MNRFNLCVDDAKDIAYFIRQRAVMCRCAVSVHVADNGRVVTRRVNTFAKHRQMPDAWLVGTYTRQAVIGDIAADLAMRRMELPA